MKIEQLERESHLRKHIALDAPLRSDEEGLDFGILFNQGPSDCEAWIEVSAGAAAGENDSHLAGSARRASGSDAPPPNTLSRVLPMLTRIPVIRRERIRFD